MLNLQNDMSRVQKLLLRFPVDFETPFPKVTCNAISNFAKTGSLNCSYDTKVRMLTITDGFPLKNKSFTFTVSGITNPESAGPTGLYSISSYT